MITTSKEANPNYLAKVVQLKDLRKHNNADRLQCVDIDFQTVITGLDAKEGDLYVYFPLECKINKDFLASTNSFRNKELNKDKEKAGFFEENCRVKAMKLRGEKSMGYIVPVNEVLKWAYGDEDHYLEVGKDFDTIGDIKLLEKYVTKTRESKAIKEGKKPKISRLVEGQVHLHVDTENLRKNIHKINPTDTISITYKTHGTSWWISNVLVKRKLSFVEKVLKRLGVKVQEEEYDTLYGSRKVVKNEYDKDKTIDEKQWNTMRRIQNKKQRVKSFMPNISEELYREIFPLDTEGTKMFTLPYMESFLPGFTAWIKTQTTDYFGYDLWRDIKDSIGEIPKGYTLYGEALGYDKNGAYIQKGYDYGCAEGEMKIEVYRITHTNPDGLVTELSYPEIEEFCAKKGLTPSHLFFYGKVYNLLAVIRREGGYELGEDNWQKSVVKYLEDKYNEKDCFMCRSKVPEEGIVLRKESLFHCESYKLKSFAFLEAESVQLDKGESDIESEN